MTWNGIMTADSRYIWSRWASCYTPALFDIIGLSSTTLTQSACKAIEFGKKRKIRAITPFKVIQSHRGRCQSKADMRLPSD